MHVQYFEVSDAACFEHAAARLIKFSILKASSECFALASPYQFGANIHWLLGLFRRCLSDDAPAIHRCIQVTSLHLMTASTCTACASSHDMHDGTPCFISQLYQTRNPLTERASQVYDQLLHEQLQFFRAY